MIVHDRVTLVRFCQGFWKELDTRNVDSELPKKFIYKKKKIGRKTVKVQQRTLVKQNNPKCLKKARTKYKRKQHVNI